MTNDRTTSGDPEDMDVRLLLEMFRGRSLFEASVHSQSDHDESSPIPLDTLGRFRIVRKLGEGGFGIVFAAIDPITNRTIALKIAKPSFHSGLALKTLNREAQALGILDHCAIVPLFEANEKDGLFYLVYQFIDGPSLAQWLCEHRRFNSLSQVIDVVTAIASALVHAHSNGVLHLDIKPSNILLATGENGTIRPYLTDFGLSRIRRDSPARDSSLHIAGTINYSAPEQLLGPLDRVGPHSDVFSLGVVMYEMLSGVTPVHASTMPEYLERLATFAAPPLRELRADVPVDLQAICSCCIALNPHDRYRDAASLHRDLQRVRAGRRPIETRRSLLKSVVGSRTSRRSLVGAATTLGLLSAIVYVKFPWHRAESSEASDQELLHYLHACSREFADWPGRLGTDLRHVMQNSRIWRNSAHFRGFEWRFLSRLALSEIRRIAPSNHNSVDAVTIDRKNRRLAFATWNSPLSVVDIKDGTLKELSLRGQTKLLRFSSSGRWLAAAPRCNHLHDLFIVDTLDDSLAAHKIATRLTGIGGLDWLDDHTLLVVGTESGAACGLKVKWSSGTGQWNTDLPFSLKGFHFAESLVRVSEQSWVFVGHRRDSLGPYELVSLSFDGEKVKCEATGFRCAEPSDAAPVAFAGIGNSWTCRGCDGSLYVVDSSGHAAKLAGEASKYCIPAGTEAFIAISENVGSDSAPTLRATAASSVLGRVNLPVGALTASCLSEDKQYMAIANFERFRRTVRLYNLAEARESVRFGNSKQAWCVRFSRDCKKLFVAGDDHCIRINDLGSGRGAVVSGQHKTLVRVMCRASGDDFVSGDHNGDIAKWTGAIGGGFTKSNVGAGDKCQAICFEPVSGHVLSGHASGMIKIWRAPADGIASMWQAHIEGGNQPQMIRGISCIDDGSTVVSVGDDGFIKVWEMGRAQPKLAFSHKCAFELSALSYSRGRNLIAIGDKGGRIEVFDCRNWESICSFASTGSEIMALKFSECGSRLASGERVGRDGSATLRVWHPCHGIQVLALRDCPGTDIRDVDWSPDGNWLACAWNNGNVTAWPANWPT